MSNPYLSKTFTDVPAEHGNSMTVGGAVQKTIFLAGCLLATLGITWYELFQSGTFFGIAPMVAMIGAAVGGLVTILITMFARGLIIPLSVVYSLFQGVFLGVLTFVVNGLYPGLPLIAAGATATTLVGVLILYQIGVLRATPAFIRIVVGATVGLMLFVGASFLLSFFGFTGLRDTFWGNGWIGIGFSVFCVVLAALNLVIDFNTIEEGAAQNAPKKFEWMAALGLMVTLVWLYIEILRLLMKLQSRE